MQQQQLRNAQRRGISVQLSYQLLLVTNDVVLVSCLWRIRQEPNYLWWVSAGEFLPTLCRQLQIGRPRHRRRSNARSTLNGAASPNYVLKRSICRNVVVTTNVLRASSMYRMPRGPLWPFIFVIKDATLRYE